MPWKFGRRWRAVVASNPQPCSSTTSYQTVVDGPSSSPASSARVALKVSSSCQRAQCSRVGLSLTRVPRYDCSTLMSSLSEWYVAQVHLRWRSEWSVGEGGLEGLRH